MSNKTKKIIFFIASLIVSVGIPLVAIVVKYDMLHNFAIQRTSVKISIVGAIILTILFLIFFKRITAFLESHEFSMTWIVIKNVLKIIPLICVSIILINMSYVIDDILFVFGWIVGCNIISLVCIQPFVEYYTYQTKKENQKNIIKEALGEYNEKN